MNTRKLIRTVTVAASEENETRTFHLEYYVIARETSLEGGAFETYGIEVLKREKTEFGSLRVEYRKVFDVFCTEREAREAAQLLARNTVTPVSVRDILEQLIGTEDIPCEEYEILAV